MTLEELWNRLAPTAYECCENGNQEAPVRRGGCLQAIYSSRGVSAGRVQTHQRRSREVALESLTPEESQGNGTAAGFWTSQLKV